MGYYKVLVISPAGFRDEYGVEAKSPSDARQKVAVMMLADRPNWRAVVATRAYNPKNDEK